MIVRWVVTALSHRLYLCDQYDLYGAMTEEPRALESENYKEVHAC